MKQSIWYFLTVYRSRPSNNIFCNDHHTYGRRTSFGSASNSFGALSFTLIKKKLKSSEIEFCALINNIRMLLQFSKEDQLCTSLRACKIFNPSTTGLPLITRVEVLCFDRRKSSERESGQNNKIDNFRINISIWATAHLPLP